MLINYQCGDGSANPLGFPKQNETQLGHRRRQTLSSLESKETQRDEGVGATGENAGQKGGTEGEH